VFMFGACNGKPKRLLIHPPSKEANALVNTILFVSLMKG
jgi:hypothetical protein